MKKKNYKNKYCVYQMYHYEETSSLLFLSIWLSIWYTISQKS